MLRLHLRDPPAKRQSLSALPPAALAAIVSTGFFALYALRLCPSLSLIGDSAEIVTACVLWGVPHAPGYPLLTAVGHAFALLPTHGVAWRVHLTSAVFHAAAVGAVMGATFNVTRSRVAALAAGWALGFSRAFYLGSLYAEVFPLNDLFFAWLFALATTHLVERGRRHGLVLFAALAGLALAHHPMIALGAPALAVILARPLKTAVAARSLSLPVLFVSMLVPPLAAYALIPLAAARSPYLSWGDVHDLRSLVALVLRSDYGGPLSPAHRASPEPWSTRLAACGRLVAHSAGAVTIAGAGVGLVDRLCRRPLVGVSLLLAVAVPGPLFSCANAIGALGGRIWATSEGLGRGASIHFAVPLPTRERVAIAGAG